MSVAKIIMLVVIDFDGDVNYGDCDVGGDYGGLDDGCCYGACGYDVDCDDDGECDDDGDYFGDCDDGGCDSACDDCDDGCVVGGDAGVDRGIGDDGDYECCDGDRCCHYVDGGANGCDSDVVIRVMLMMIVVMVLRL